MNLSEFTSLPVPLHPPHAAALAGSPVPTTLPFETPPAPACTALYAAVPSAPPPTSSTVPPHETNTTDEAPLYILLYPHFISLSLKILHR